MKMKVPYFKQDTSYTCGPVSLQMAFDFFGYFKGEKRLAKEAGSDYEKGTRHKGMMETVKKNGFYYCEKNNASLDDVCRFLEKQLPVIIHFIEPSENASHYSLVIGVENGMVIMNDPWNGAGYRLSEKDFTERWHCKCGHYKKWLMVISKEPITFE